MHTPTRRSSDASSVDLIVGDARNLDLPDGSVDTIVTSVPFWQIRGYEDGEGFYEGQIGVEVTIDEWLTELWVTIAEMARVLKKTGSIFLHIQDKYNSDTGGRNYAGTGEGSGVMSPDAPYKSLLFIPQRLAEGCVDPDYAAWRMTRAGASPEQLAVVAHRLPLILREEIIVWRYNAMPESVHDRCRRQHEYMLHFTVSPDYFADLDVIRERQKHADHVQIGKKHSGDRWSADDLAEGTRRWAVESRQLDPRGAPPVSVWETVTEPFRIPKGLVYDDTRDGQVRFADLVDGQTRPIKVHTATYPPSLVRRCVQGWTPTGWTVHDEPLTAAEAATYDGEVFRSVVLDPFSGTGTTALVARALGHDTIGTDLSTDYTNLARWRVHDPQQVAKVMGKANKEAQTELF